MPLIIFNKLNYDYFMAIQNQSCLTSTAQNDAKPLNMTANKPVNTPMEEYLKHQQQVEDQIDYQFIQRIIQELTQSCALNVPIPAAAIPNLILQAAQFFWENDDQSIEERYYCIPYRAIAKCGPNKIIKLPEQIISVFGVYKLQTAFHYGALGDFSLERMIINNSALAAGVGGSLSDVFGTGTGYNLVDVMGAMYEIQTYKSMFDYPITYNYNMFSKELVLLGDLGKSDLLLQVYKRLKIQDLYKSYYFFRYCVCLGLKSMATIMGTYEFKLPGGITLNYSIWRDMADQEMDKIYEWIQQHHSADYFFNTNTI
jgi:hypothetical protein